MRWQGGRRSTNVQDRRGRSAGVIGGGIGVVVLALVAALFGIDPGVVLQGGAGGAPAGPAGPADGPPAADEMGIFVERVLASTEDTWNTLFQQEGLGDYPEPQLVLFSGAVDSACGRAGASVGPFYCPGDQQVYIDLSFYDQLRQQLGAPGDFAQAYVIAHEVGHHIQTVTGVSQQVIAASRRASETEANALSVRQELQADCFAGVWARDAQRSSIVLDPGDLEEALNAASAIGDDRMQKQSQGYVVPESFTHGTSEQRVRWFRRGFDSGQMRACDTFNATSL